MIVFLDPGILKSMFNLGFSEILIIAVIALIVIGPKQLPEVARIVGKLIGEFKRTTEDMTSQFINTKNKADKYMRETEQEIEASLLPEAEGESKTTEKDNKDDDGDTGDTGNKPV